MRENISPSSIKFYLIHPLIDFLSLFTLQSSCYSIIQIAPKKILYEAHMCNVNLSTENIKYVEEEFPEILIKLAYYINSININKHNEVFYLCGRMCGSFCLMRFACGLFLARSFRREWTLIQGYIFCQKYK